MRTVITPNAHDAEEVGGLIRHLHTLVEEDRAALARELHDEMGGLLVSAAMDLGWAEAHVTDSGLKARLRRLGTSLGGVIHLEREVIERLRPTLLDTMGLFEALRWYFKHACRRDSAQCSEGLPWEEIPFAPASLSNIFRVTQCLLDCTFQEEAIGAVDFNAIAKENVLLIRLAHSHIDQETTDVQERFGFELQSAAFRTAAVGGELSYEHLPRGLAFQLTVPMNAETVTSS